MIFLAMHRANAAQPRGDLLWHVETAQLPCESSVTVDENDHILVVDGSSACQLSPNGGGCLWRQRVAQDPDNFALSPATYTGINFVPGKHELAAIDSNGTVLWRSPSIGGAAFTGSPSLSHDGRLLYVGCGWDSDCEAVTARRHHYPAPRPPARRRRDGDTSAAAAAGCAVNRRCVFLASPALSRPLAPGP